MRGEDKPRRIREACGRLLGEDVESRSAEPPGTKGLRKCVHVDEVGTGRIEEKCACRHEVELPPPEQVPCRGRERNVEGHRAARRQQLVQLGSLRSGLPDRAGSDHRVARPDLHAEREGALGDGAPDSPHPDDAEAGPTDPAQNSCRLVVPITTPDVAVENDNAAKKREEHRHCGLGHLLDAVVRHVRDPDPVSRSRLEVDMVIPDTAGRDDAQRGQALDVLSVDGIVGTDQEADDVVALPGRFRLLDANVCRRENLVKGVERKARVADKDASWHGRGLIIPPASPATPMHEKRIEIRWRDQDAYGHVNNAVYLTFLEEVRDAWLARTLGDEGDLWGYVVARVAIDFRRELKQDDGYVIARCELQSIGTSSVRTRERLVTGEGTLAAEAEAVLVARNPDSGASRPLTALERAAFEREAGAAP